MHWPQKSIQSFMDCYKFSMQAWYVEKNKFPKFTLLKPQYLESKEVRVEVYYSSINYKDALGFTQKGKIYRNYPIVPGIDFSGIVVESKSERFKPGDCVLATGCGYGESRNGGYASHVVASETDLIAISKDKLRESMILGTAGFTVGLARHRMEALGQTPSKGKILISGASGGVGSISCLFLSKLGYQVDALTSKKQVSDYLKTLGASSVLSWQDLNLGDKALESIKYAGCIDNLGGEYLSKILSHIDLFGNIASIGLAAGTNVNITTMPFILRGVSLVGVSSTNCPQELRQKVWSDIWDTLSSEDLKKLQIQEFSLEKIESCMNNFFEKKVIGRYIVNVKMEAKAK